MSRALSAFVEPLSHGIYAIDTGFHRPRFDAAYLIVEQGRAAFVDTGTNHAVPRLLATLEALGLEPDDVDAVIPTHVHLDHAGGVGLLMQSLPRATCWVHERGLRHLVDPSALYAGALAIYGALYAGALAIYGEDEMARSYGRVVPVPESRARATVDGMTIDLAGRPLLCIDTPGHARHHHCLWDEASRGWFTGDTFGLSVREFDVPGRGAWVVPAATPSQFEPDALRASVTRLLARDPRWVYVTHYGRVGEPQRLGALLLSLLDEMVALGLTLRHETDRKHRLEKALERLYLRSLEAHGCVRADAAELLAIDVKLNAMGLAGWLDRPVRTVAS